MAKGGASVKAERAIESSTETLVVLNDTESDVSDNECALLDKLKHLEKRKKKVTLEQKVKLLEVEISRMSISDNIGNMKEVENGNGDESRDDRG